MNNEPDPKNIKKVRLFKSLYKCRLTFSATALFAVGVDKANSFFMFSSTRSSLGDAADLFCFLLFFWDSENKKPLLKFYVSEVIICTRYLMSICNKNS